MKTIIQSPSHRNILLEIATIFPKARIGYRTIIACFVLSLWAGGLFFGGGVEAGYCDNDNSISCTYGDDSPCVSDRAYACYRQYPDGDEHCRIECHSPCTPEEGGGVGTTCCTYGSISNPDGCDMRQVGSCSGVFCASQFSTCEPEASGTCIATCTGTTPTNAYLCPGDSSGLSADTPRTVVNSCTSGTKCEYTCALGFMNSGGSCVPAASCSSTPPTPNSLVCNDGGTPGSANQAGTLVNSCSPSVACDWTCGSGYYKSGTSCLESPYCSSTPPTPNSLACNDGGTPTGVNQAGTFVNSCSASVACDWTCAPTHYRSGSQCLPYVCVGNAPANSELCDEDDIAIPGGNTTRTLVPVCGVNKCEYICDALHYYEGGECKYLVPESCGDGDTDPGEQCDDGNTSDNDACTNECKSNVCGDGIVNINAEECEGSLGCDQSTCLRIDPACTLTASATTVNARQVVTFTATFPGNGVETLGMNFGDGQNTKVATTMTHAYAEPGTYLAHFSVQNASENKLTTTCQTTITVPELGACGNGVADTGEECGEPGLSCSSDEVCVTSTCRCEQMCPLGSDGTVDFYVSPFAFGDGRDAQVEDSLDHQYLYEGTFTAGFSVINPGNSAVKAECYEIITVEERLCGNNIVDPGEECGEPGLSCSGDDICNPFGCRCANSCEETVEILEEECDDGNLDNGDGCNNICQEEFCGDGLIDGNGVNNTAGDTDDELCDDGNRNNDDACDNRCRNGCGNGITEPSLGEECDGGSYCKGTGVDCTFDPYVCETSNPKKALESCVPRDTELCSASCKEEDRCGDGETQTQNASGQNEECDTGADVNTITSDGFTSACYQCVKTYCGDGIKSYINFDGVKEVCDDGPLNGSADSGCTTSCQLKDISPNAQCWVNPYYDGDLSAFADQDVSDLCLLGTPQVHAAVLQYQQTTNSTLPKSLLANGIYDNTDGSLGGNTPKTFLRRCLGGENGVDAQGRVDCQAWICGDGVVDLGVELCDDGNRTDGDGCDSSCQLEDPFSPPVPDSPAFSGSCHESTDGGLSVMEDELLPLRWQGSVSNHVEKTAADCNAMKNIGTGKNGIPGGLLKCDVGMKRAGSVIPDEVIGGRDITCLQGVAHGGVTPSVALTTAQGGLVMNDVLDDYEVDRSSLLGVSIVRPDKVAGLTSPTWDEDGNPIEGGDRKYGQFSAYINDVDYTYCGRTRDTRYTLLKDSGIDGAPARNTGEPIWSSYEDTYKIVDEFGDMEPVCSINFTISNAYFLQKGVAVSENESTTPENFFSLEGRELVGLDARSNRTAVFNGAGKNYLLNDFIEEYEKLANVVMPIMINNISRTFKKVPNDRIYFLGQSGAVRTYDFDTKPEGNTNIILDEGDISQIVGDINEPFTLIIKGANLIFRGSVRGKGLYVVDKNNIIFDAYESDGNCDDTDVIRGIFVTNGEFLSSKVRNDKIDGARRCKGGNMLIEGVLIGNREFNPSGLSFNQKRRSVLDAWSETSDVLFNQTITTDSGSGVVTTTLGLDPLIPEGGTIVQCTDNKDNDEDGLVDCEEDTCRLNFANSPNNPCAPIGFKEVCEMPPAQIIRPVSGTDYTFDEDKDGYIDCFDNECRNNSSGPIPYCEARMKALGMFEFCYRPAVEFNQAKSDGGVVTLLFRDGGIIINNVTQPRYREVQYDFSNQTIKSVKNKLGINGTRDHDPYFSLLLESTTTSTVDPLSGATAPGGDIGTNTEPVQTRELLSPLPMNTVIDINGSSKTLGSVFCPPPVSGSSGTNDRTEVGPILNAGGSPVLDGQGNQIQAITCKNINSYIESPLCALDGASNNDGEPLVFGKWTNQDRPAFVSNHDTAFRNELDNLRKAFMSLDSEYINFLLSEVSIEALHPKHSYYINTDWINISPPLSQNDLDGDGLLDGDDDNITNPDYNGDGICEGPKTVYSKTSPYSLICYGVPLGNTSRDDDADSDGIPNSEEYASGNRFSSPVLADTDGDGLNDYEEKYTHLTNPSQRDTDGDEVGDKQEIILGRNPLVIETAEDPEPIIITEDKAILKARTDNLIQGASMVVKIDPSIWSLNPPGAQDFLREIRTFKQ